MPIPAGLGFLLPIGLWLVMSAAEPPARQARAAAVGLLVICASTLAFALFGFGLMFGGIGAATEAAGYGQLSSFAGVTIAGRPWAVAGLRGFLLSNVSSSELTLLLAYLPLVQACALVLASAMVRSAPLAAHLVAATVVAGLLFPLIGGWLWAGGWLGALGSNLQLGHGGADLGGLSTAALVSGCAAMAWLVMLPRRQIELQPTLPEASYPFRAFVGVGLVGVGAVAVPAGSPILTPLLQTSVGNYAISGLTAMCASGVTAGAYAIFTTRRLDPLLMTRAMVAAWIAVAAGGPALALLPSVAIGFAVGCLVPLVSFAVSHVWRLQDDECSLATALVPGAAGLVLCGLLASGNTAIGLNGVGVTDYLAVAQLGLVGLFPSAAVPADPGQLTAQLITVAAVAAASTMTGGLVLAPFRRAAAQLSATSTAAGVQDRNTAVPSAQLSLPITPTDAEAPPATTTPKSPTEGVLARLRRMRVERDQPKAPSQARKVAYPTRVGGKRLFVRPLVEEQPRPDQTTSPD